MSVSGEKHCAVVSVNSCTRCFLNAMPFHLLERLTLAIQTEVYVMYFLQNEPSEPVISSKIAGSVYCQLSQAFRCVEFWNTCIQHHACGCFSIFNDFPDDVGGDINKCDCLI